MRSTVVGRSAVLARRGRRPLRAARTRRACGRRAWSGRAPATGRCAASGADTVRQQAFQTVSSRGAAHSSEQHRGRARTRRAGGASAGARPSNR
eukprot:7253942-Prymnesium_polylepis.1